MEESDKKEHKFMDYVHEFYKSMRTHDIGIVYEGKITHQITKAFIALTESDMAERQESEELKKLVFHVMVESLQNITKHGGITDQEKENEEGRGIFLVSKNGNAYSVLTGNVTSNENANALKEVLNKVNSSSQDDLKQMYRDQIKKDRKLGKKGNAGLGFIDIARKTQNKIEYKTVYLSDETVFFIMLVKINNQ
jgi:hypothetical protein